MDIIRLAEEAQQPRIVTDEDKQIEVVKMVEQVEKFSIRQLQNDIKSCDEQITRLQTRKVELQAKIDAVTTSLDLTITEIAPLQEKII
jgi:peptidoglycan hydrolase CwlO-like protein